MTTDYTLSDKQRLSMAYATLEAADELDDLYEVMDTHSCRDRVLELAEKELKQDTEAKTLADHLRDETDKLDREERLASGRLFWHYSFFGFIVHLVGVSLFFILWGALDYFLDVELSALIPIGLAVTVVSFSATFVYCSRYAKDISSRQLPHILPSVLAYVIAVVLPILLIILLFVTDTQNGFAILSITGTMTLFTLAILAPRFANSAREIIESFAVRRNLQLADFDETSRQLDNLSLVIVQNAKRVVEKELGVQKFEPWVHTLPLYKVERPARNLVERYEYYHPNSAFESLRQYIEQHDKGSIGLAGERGIGKTSLMRGLQTWFRRKESQEYLTIWISSPTAFNEKEFLLSVLAKLATTAGARLTGNESWPRRPPASELQEDDRAGRWNRRFLAATTVAMAITAILYVFSKGGSIETEESMWFRIFMLVSILVPGIWIFFKLFRALGPPRLDCPSDQVRPYVAASIQLLEELWYERKEIQVTNFSLSYFGAAIRGHAGSEKTREPFTLPHLVEMWNRYLELIAGPGAQFQKVIVFIDELDKIPNTESIGKFLLVLKSLYDPDHLFFVISISDDAYRMFQTRRSMHRRGNRFDSSVGHVERITNMSHAEVCGLLERRVLGPKLPHPATLLIWVLSEGNPRDVVRLARNLLVELTEAGEKSDFLEIARTLWHQRFGRGFSDPQWTIFVQEDPELPKTIRCYDESFEPANVRSLLKQAIGDVEGLSSQGRPSESKEEARENLLVKLWYALIAFELFCTQEWKKDPKEAVERLVRLHRKRELWSFDRALHHQSNAAPRQAVQLLRELHQFIAE